MSNENRQLYQDGNELAQVHPYYLKYKINGNDITERYVCFIANNTEHCLQGGAHENNVLTLQGVTSWFETNGGSCSRSGKEYGCTGAGFVYVHTGLFGDVSSSDNSGECYIEDFSTAYCHE